MKKKINKPEWWPKNPFPKNIFTMTEDEYVKAIPDPKLRTAISGFISQWAWDAASKQIFEAYMDSLEEDGGGWWW